MGVIGRAPVVERIDLANEPEFELGGMRVKPSERAVEMNGERRELQPRVMQVLVALAQARQTVVSRDKLVEQCWEGRIVGDDSLNRCVLALRHLAEELDPQPFAIETVPRIGHRLVENGSKGGGTAANPAKPKLWLLVAVLLVSLVAGLGLYAWQQRNAAPNPASIAVLPFRNLGNGDAYLAEGIGEEILGQLAREPAFRVAGRASAAKFSAASDPREVGRALGVDYILEGSVRSGEGRVRVSASLVKTSDGIRLWSETYDRKLDDIFAIQTAIGEAVANGLSRQLTLASRGTRPINGEAYALVLNARGLVRSGNPQSGHDAVELLEEAIRRDPNFAPAWAELAEALLLEGRTKGADGLIAVVPRANKAARHALQLDPNLAQAHGVLAQVLGTETPEAIAHLRRAADLDPRSGDGLMWRGVAHEVSGEYAEALATYYRAHEADPVWPHPLRGLITVNAIMGDRPAAERLVASGMAGDPMTQQFALARAAWFLGDISEAARRWSIVASDPNARFVGSARLSLEDARHTLGLSKEPPARPALATLGSSRFGPRVWMAAAPSPAEWQRRNRSFAATLVNFDENAVAAKLMLAAGRARELVAAYDGPHGVLSIRPSLPLGTCQLDEATTVALALRAVGRNREADALLAKADALIQHVYGRGKVPTWFDEDAAGVWAAQGKSGPAIEGLDRALRRGWAHIGRTDLLKLEDEPAFRSLRGNPRFEVIRSKYEAHYARERKETARALKIPS